MAETIQRLAVHAAWSAANARGSDWRGFSREEGLKTQTFKLKSLRRKKYCYVKDLYIKYNLTWTLLWARKICAK